MDDLQLLELDAPYGVHLHHVERPEGALERGIKSAAQSSAKWIAGTSLASGPTGSWVTNLRDTNKPIVDAAIAAEGLMVQRFNAAVQNGKYSGGLRKVGDAGIKAAALAKEANYATGTAAGSPGAAKQQAFMVKLIAYEASNLPQIYAMAKGTLPAGKARMNAWADIMAAGAGSFT